MKLFLTIFCFSLLLPLISSAQMEDFVPLVGIPGVDLTESDVLGQYINALYILVITIAAILAVGRLILAGVKYIVSDVVPTKESAKKDIYTSILGLVIVLSAVLILNTINPQLTNLSALGNLDAVKAEIKYFQVYGLGDDSVISDDDPEYIEKVNEKIEECRLAGNSYELIQFNGETKVNCNEDNLEVAPSNAVLEYEDGVLVPLENYASELDSLTFDCISEINTECLNYCDSIGGARPNRERPFECTIAIPQEVEEIHCTINNTQCEEQVEITEEEVIAPDMSIGESEFYYESAAACATARDINPGIFTNCLKREVNIDSEMQEVYIPTDSMGQAVDTTLLQNDLTLILYGNVVEVNSNSYYTINEPAVPSLGLEAGPFDGEVVQIIGGNNETAIVVVTSDGRQRVVGCSALIPSIPGCQ